MNKESEGHASVPDNAKKLYSLAKEPKELHLIKGADHMYSDKKKFAEMQKLIKDWFEKTCK